MTEADRSAPINFVLLEEHLKVLSYASRMQLLSILRAPRTIDEIILTPGPSQAGESPTRPISRQGVHQHLAQLKEAGLIRVRPTERKGKHSQNEYVVDRARLYAIIEELRRISTLGPITDVGPAETLGLHQRPAAPWPAGAKLILAHGVHEGQAFLLAPGRLKPPRGWIVGRSGSAHVSLDYDPFVSSENAEILLRGTQYSVLDLRTARNGTYLNWSRLPVGSEANLKAGDIIGVGRSLLVFQPV